MHRLLLIYVLLGYLPHIQAASSPPTLPPWTAFEFLHELQAAYEIQTSIFYMWGPLEFVESVYQKEAEEEEKIQRNEKDLFREIWGVPSLG